MIDPLRPYWPTNRSIAGLLARSLCLLCAAGLVWLEVSRYVGSVVVALAALVQSSLLVFEWMELKRTRRSGVIAAGIVVFLFLSLLGVLLIESRSILVGSVR